MNKSKLKSYAPQARNDFIAMVTSRANQLGISEAGGQLQIESCTVQGDVALIGGQAYPAKVAQLRQRLLARIKQHGFGETMEAIAYTWFNRFAALRYMELHNYLDHGQRVLSSVNPDSLPDILTHALELVEGADLTGINRDDVAELKLAGKDGELYKRLLVAQCNKLASAMPFLFERIDDDSELLLPDNLLRSDSVIAKLIAEIPEEDWAEVEIIGWLYQFYISEKKDQVIGKVVKSEDIPAATQLFTPNWIVQYLVQNSVGRLWLMANPQSTLAKEWPYYITPAEQTPEVQAQLDALIQTRVREDGDTLNPESITVLDPACGSGHILVVAYDVLKAIYLERGYQPRSIPRLILEKNLYGLDIDDRAAQMAGFALLMKARADDRRLFTATDDAGNLQPPKLNVLSLQESKGLSVDELATHLAPFKVQRASIAALVETFEHAKTFGSLIQIPYALKTHLTLLPEILTSVRREGDMYAAAAADDFLPLVQQAQVLAMQFDAVVANPPYMGSKYLEKELKEFVNATYPNAKGDLFSCFIERGYTLTNVAGYSAMITMQSWMFLSSFEQMREQLVRKKTIESMAHLGNGVMIGFGTVAFVLKNISIPSFFGTYSYISAADISAEGAPLEFPVKNRRFSVVSQEKFKRIPGVPIGYWVSNSTISAFEKGRPIGDRMTFKQGMATSDNERFLRQWHEVSQNDVDTNCNTPESLSTSAKKWFPYSKGGTYRKWYGNNELLVNWEDDGREMKSFTSTLPQGMNVRLKSREYYCLPSLTYSTLALTFGCRMNDSGFIFDVKGSCIFGIDADRAIFCGFLNTNVARHFLEILCPTLDFQMAGIRQVPVLVGNIPDCSAQAMSARRLSMEDWDSYERSWNFQSFPLLPSASALTRTIESSYITWVSKNREMVAKLRQIETEINRHFIDAYGLNEEISPEVPIEEVTLTVNPAYRYGGNVVDEDKWSRFRLETCQELISYAIGCMMGRYSLDEPGLIYAHAGNVGFEPGRYATFPADADGIVPITDELWFADDAPSRIREFLRAGWGAGTLDENMAWLAESLGPKGNEMPAETIRRYLSSSFFKDHLQTYKKRPIYWLFSSGKHKAFEALVYMHRYNEGTLSRMRAEYVVPLSGKMAERIKLLEDDANKASAPAARKKIDKDIDKLKKKLDELRTYDEKLRHYADMRINLDLDDGVKVNYGKFGDLLAEVKAVTGGSEE